MSELRDNLGIEDGLNGILVLYTQMASVSAYKQIDFQNMTLPHMVNGTKIAGPSDITEASLCGCLKCAGSENDKDSEMEFLRFLGYVGCPNSEF